MAPPGDRRLNSQRLRATASGDPKVYSSALQKNLQSALDTANGK
jgi:hypothetical protein